MVPPNDPWAALFAAVGALFRAGWRYRSELAPAYTALVLFVVGGWAHARHPGWAWPFAVLSAGAALFLACPPYRLRVWTVRRATAGPRLDLRTERAYASAVVAFGGSWLAAATWWGPTHPPLGVVLLWGGLGLAVPWWWRGRRRSKSKVDRKMADWPQIAEAVGLAGSTAMSWVTNTFGWVARIRLRRGQSVQTAINQLTSIESGLRTRLGSVRIEPDPNHADQFTLRVIETDPHADPIPWAGSQYAADKEKASITRPVELGLWEDGQPVQLMLLRRNGLIGGTTGAGKSGLVNVILAALVVCADVVVWGIDLKGGMELAPWSGCLGRLATTADDAVALLRDAVAELDRRAALLAQLGGREWHPSPQARALIIVVDEYAELPDQAHPYADSLARRGRAVAVNLLAATQRPTQQAMGHGAVRSQMDVRICLRVRERRDVDLILGQGAHHAGWHADRLDTAGRFLLSTPEYTQPKRARAYHITNEDVAHVARRHATHPPIRPARSAPPTGPDQHQPGRRKAGRNRLAGNEPDTRRGEADALLWTVLCDAPPEGVSVVELVEITGMSRATVYRRLQVHAMAGRAEQTGDGRWRATISRPGPAASPARPT